MEALGQGKQYRAIILAEISQVGESIGEPRGRAPPKWGARDARAGGLAAAAALGATLWAPPPELQSRHQLPLALCRNCGRWKTLTASGARSFGGLLPSLNQPRSPASATGAHPSPRRVITQSAQPLWPPAVSPGHTALPCLGAPRVPTAPWTLPRDTTALLSEPLRPAASDRLNGFPGKGPRHSESHAHVLRPCPRSPSGLSSLTSPSSLCIPGVNIIPFITPILGPTNLTSYSLGQMFDNELANRIHLTWVTTPLPCFQRAKAYSVSDTLHGCVSSDLLG